MPSRTESYNIDINTAFRLAQNTIHNIGRFNIDNLDYTNMIIYVSTGVSGFSWGEDVIVRIQRIQFGSSVTVTSNPKLFTNIFAGGNARQNINDFFQEFERISGCHPI